MFSPSASCRRRCRTEPPERLPVQLFDTEPDVHSRIIYPGVGVQLGVESTILPAVFG